MSPFSLPDLRAGQQLLAGLGFSTVHANFDFETYSEAGFVWIPELNKWKCLPMASQGKKGLPVCGLAVYASHPSTEILSLSYDFRDGAGKHRWRPDLPPPYDLFEHIRQGKTLSGWNVAFEYWIWNCVGTRRYGWPPLPFNVLVDSMAKARAFSMPGKLAEISKVLPLSFPKDPEGERLIKKFTMPRDPTKADPRPRIKPADDPADAERFWQYNDRDTDAECEVGAWLPDLSPNEHAYWVDDQTINLRGVQIDLPLVEACIEIINAAVERYNAELLELTDCKPTELQKLQGWLHGRGVHLDAMDEEAIEKALKWDLPPDCRRALEIRAIMGSASVKKVFAMKNQVAPWGRLHDLYTFHGAHTGRPTGNGPQPTNLPKAGPKVYRCGWHNGKPTALGGCGRHHGAHTYSCPWCGKMRGPDAPAGWSPEAMDDAIEVILGRSLDLLQWFFGDAMLTIAGCLRGMFIAKPGHVLVSSDYSAIEAVVIAALANEEWRLEVFRTHGKIYEVSASKITGMPFEEFERHKRETGTHHPLRNKVGKIAELALGFMGWIDAWRRFDGPGTDDEVKKNILAWRAASPAIVHLAGAQHRDFEPCDPFGCEGMAIKAVQNPGVQFKVIRLDGTESGITYYCTNDTLYCKVPSGGLITYHRPRLDRADKEWRGLSLTYERWNSNADMGPIGWVRLALYAGKAIENCIAEGTQVLTKRGWVGIEQIQSGDQIHDGACFVSHAGLVSKTRQTCIEVDGVYMTPDHLVLTNEGWQAASSNPQPYRPDLRGIDSNLPRPQQRPRSVLAFALRLWTRLRKSWNRRSQGSKARGVAQLRMPYPFADESKGSHSRHESTPGLRSVALNGRSLLAAFTPSMGEIWRSRHSSLREVGCFFRELLEGHGAFVLARTPARTKRQQQGLFPPKLRMGNSKGPSEQHAQQHPNHDPLGATDCLRSSLTSRDQLNDSLLPSQSLLAAAQAADPCRSSQPRVFDIMNCGPLHRFVVRGASGPFIVHNCVQKVARDVQMNAIRQLEASGQPIVLHTYDEDVAEVPIESASIERFEAEMNRLPSWAAGWPIKAAGGWIGHRYRKAE
jgi:DNA polymerase